MKNIHTNFMAEYILKLTGEYASAIEFMMY